MVGLYYRPLAMDPLLSCEAEWRG